MKAFSSPPFSVSLPAGATRTRRQREPQIDHRQLGQLGAVFEVFRGQVGELLEVGQVPAAAAETVRARAEGALDRLIDPERTPSGYRKFYDDDVQLLRVILAEQGENYLPLRVIKDRLETGEIDPTGAGDSTSAGVVTALCAGADLPEDGGDPTAL